MESSGRDESSRAADNYVENTESGTHQETASSTKKDKASEGIVGGCRRKDRREEQTNVCNDKNKFRRGQNRRHPRNQRSKVVETSEGHTDDVNENKDKIRSDWRKRKQKKIFSNHNQEDLIAPIKILEMENESLKKHNTELKESIEEMQGEIEQLHQQHNIFEETIKKIEEEKENLQKKNINLHVCLGNLSKTTNLFMEECKKQQESKSILEETIKLMLEGDDSTEEINEGSHSEEASEETVRNLERENERLQEYSSALEENIKQFTEAFEELNNNIIQTEEMIERLKISESAHEDTVKALLKASENQQEKELSLKLRIEELQEEKARQEALIANTENTVKMLMEENEMYENTEEALKGQVRKCEEDSERYRESHLCIICINEEVQMVFRPCRHLITCCNCTKELHNCPLCRQKIVEMFQVYKQ